MVEQHEYTKSCQKLLHNWFATEPTKSILFELRNLIDNSPNKTVSGSDINLFLDKKGLNKWKLSNWDVISNERLKMFKQEGSLRRYLSFILDDRLSSLLKVIFK